MNFKIILITLLGIILVLGGYSGVKYINYLKIKNQCVSRINLSLESTLIARITLNISNNVNQTHINDFVQQLSSDSAITKISVESKQAQYNTFLQRHANESQILEALKKMPEMGMNLFSPTIYADYKNPLDLDIEKEKLTKLAQSDDVTIDKIYAADYTGITKILKDAATQISQPSVREFWSYLIHPTNFIDFMSSTCKALVG